MEKAWRRMIEMDAEKRRRFWVSRDQEEGHAVGAASSRHTRERQQWSPSRREKRKGKGPDIIKIEGGRGGRGGGTKPGVTCSA